MENTNNQVETVTIPKTAYDNMVDTDQLSITAERLDSALLLLYDMQDDFFRAYEPNQRATIEENACVLYEFPRYRAYTNAIAELLTLIKKDFKDNGISWK